MKTSSEFTGMIEKSWSDIMNLHRRLDNNSNKFIVQLLEWSVSTIVVKVLNAVRFKILKSQTIVTLYHVLVI